MELFISVIKIIEIVSTEEIQMGMWEIIKKIILRHETNEILLRKIKYLLYIANSDFSNFVKNNL